MERSRVKVKAVIIFLLCLTSGVVSKAVEFPIKENVETKSLYTSQNEYLEHEEASQIQPHDANGKFYNPVMEDLLINAIKSSAVMVSQDEAINKYAIMLNDPNRKKVDVHLFPIKTEKESRSILKDPPNTDESNNNFNDSFTNSIWRKRQENSKKFQDYLKSHSNAEGNNTENNYQREITNLNAFTKLAEYHQHGDLVKSSNDPTKKTENEISDDLESSTRQTHVTTLDVEKNSSQSSELRPANQLQSQLNNITQKSDDVDIELANGKVKASTSKKVINNKNTRGKAKFSAYDSEENDRVLEKETENYPDLNLFRKAVKNYTHRFESHKIPEYVPRYDEPGTESYTETGTTESYTDNIAESTRSVVAKIGGFLTESKLNTIKPSQFDLKSIRIENSEPITTTTMPKRVIKVIKQRKKSYSSDIEITTDFETSTESFTTVTAPYTDFTSTVADYDKEANTYGGFSQSSKSVTATPITYVVQTNRKNANRKNENTKSVSKFGFSTVSPSNSESRHVNLSNVDDDGRNKKDETLFIKNEIETANLHKESPIRATTPRNRIANLHSSTTTSLDKSYFNTRPGNVDTQSNNENNQRNRGQVKYMPTKFETISPFYSDTQLKQFYNEQGIAYEPSNPELGRDRGDLRYNDLIKQKEEAQTDNGVVNDTINTNRGSTFAYREKSEASSRNPLDLSRGQDFSILQTHEDDVNGKNIIRNRKTSFYNADKKVETATETASLNVDFDQNKKINEDSAESNKFQKGPRFANRPAGYLNSQTFRSSTKIEDDSLAVDSKGRNILENNKNDQNSNSNDSNLSSGFSSEGKFNSFVSTADLNSEKNINFPPGNNQNNRGRFQFGTIGNNINNFNFNTSTTSTRNYYIPDVPNVPTSSIQSGFTPLLQINIHDNTEKPEIKTSSSSYKNDKFTGSYFDHFDTTPKTSETFKFDSSSYFGSTNRPSISESFGSVTASNPSVIRTSPNNLLVEFERDQSHSENPNETKGSSSIHSTNLINLQTTQTPLTTSQNLLTSNLQKSSELSTSFDAQTTVKNDFFSTNSDFNQNTYTAKSLFTKDDSKTYTRSNFNPGESDLDVTQPGKSTASSEGDQFESSTKHVIGNNISKNDKNASRHASKLNIVKNNNDNDDGGDQGKNDLYNINISHEQLFKKPDNINIHITNASNHKYELNNFSKDKISTTTNGQGSETASDDMNSTSTEDDRLISKFTNVFRQNSTSSSTMKISPTRFTKIGNNREAATLQTSGVTRTSSNFHNNNSKSNSNDLQHGESSNDKLASNYAGKTRTFDDYQITSQDNLERGSKKYAPTKFETISPYITDSHLKNIHDRPNTVEKNEKPNVIQYEDGKLEVYNGNGAKGSTKTQFRGNVKFKWDPRSINWNYDDDEFPRHFSYNYNTSTGISAYQHGVLKEIDSQKVFVIKGSYQYTAPDGSPVVVKYTADEFGFHPQVVTPMPNYEEETVRTKEVNDVDENYEE